MISFLAQLPGPSDPAQSWTAIGAVIVIAMAFVYTAVKWPSDAKAERTEMTTAFGKLLDASRLDAQKEREKMEVVVLRVCASFDKAVEEMRHCREADREACAAFSRLVCKTHE